MLLLLVLCRTPVCDLAQQVCTCDLLVAGCESIRRADPVGNK